MAYTPYPQGYPMGGYPAGYYSQPVPDQLAQLRQQQIQQPIMQGAQLPQQAQPVPANMGPGAMGAPQNSGILWVSGRAEADGYLVAPNSAVALWDANNPVIYLRQADGTGKPSTKVYDLVERTDGPAPRQEAPQIDFSRFITREELEEILSERLKRPVKAQKAKEDTENG